MKVINTGKDKALVRNVKKQFREAMKNYIGKLPDFSLIEDKVSATLNKLAEQQIMGYNNLRVTEAEEPNCINIEFELYLPKIQYVNLNLKSWIEIREDWHIFLENIPQHKALSMALYEYFLKITPEKWPTDYNFIMLECANCSQISYYQDMTDIPVECGDHGQVGCVYCGHPWLTYSYSEV
jgi:hypothetical protein